MNQNANRTKVSIGNGYGYVYIFTNPCFSNLVKIGCTEKDPVERAKELYTSGVPSPYNVYAHLMVKEFNKVEHIIHKILEINGCRFNDKREFFDINPEKALDILNQISKIIDGEIYIYPKVKKEEDKEYQNVKAFENALTINLFDKVISFERNSIFIREDIFSKHIDNLLIFGNLVNLFGPDSNRFYMSNNMKDNVKHIKSLIKRNPNIMIHFWGNNEICNHFKKVCKIMKIDIVKNVRFEIINNLSELNTKIKHMKFDVAILNPPYLGRGYISILESIVSHTDRILFISPLSWLLNRPKSSNILKLASRCQCVVEFIDSKEYFGRNGHDFCGITYIDKTVSDKNITLNECTYDTVEHLTYADGFEVLRTLKDKIITKMSDNVHNHIYSMPYVREKMKTQSENLPCVVIPRNIGDKHCLFSNISMCIIKPNDIKNHTVIKQFDDFTKSDKFYIPCPSKNYANNLVKFLITDFARVCLSFCKHNIDLIQNRSMRFIPWLDFNDDNMFSGTITDISNRLFKNYGVSLTKEQRVFIDQKIPKVYNL